METVITLLVILLIVLAAAYVEFSIKTKTGKNVPIMAVLALIISLVRMLLFLNH